MRYMPESFWPALGKLIEECGEVQHACGKTLRFGTDSTDPTLTIPIAERETNLQWILREIEDLEQSIQIFRTFALTGTK